MKVLCHAFDLTLKEFDIKGSHLSEASEVASGTISNFRNDLCSITTDSLEKLLEALSDEEFTFWLSQVAHARGIEEFISNPIALDGFASKLDYEDTATLLTALASRLRKEGRKNKPSPANKTRHNSRDSSP